MSNQLTHFLVYPNEVVIPSLDTLKSLREKVRGLRKERGEGRDSGSLTRDPVSPYVP